MYVRIQTAFLFVLLLSVPGVALGQPYLSEALAIQRSLALENPDDPALLNDLANLLLLAGEMNESEDTYRRAIELAPESISVHYNLGLLLQQTERPEKARREFQQVITLNPEHAWSHYQLGVLLAASGRRSSAIEQFATALRLDPRLTDPAFNPHIVENDLAASATLMAYSHLSPATLAPRIYEEPSRIAGLLLPLPVPFDQSRAAKPTVEEDAASAEEEPVDSAPARDTEAVEDEEKPAPEPPSTGDPQ
jgi:tetratricopeptide (TPR) repeat protein